MRKFAKVLAAAACLAVLVAGQPFRVSATVGGGLYETLSGIYGTSQTGQNTASGTYTGTSTGTSAGTVQGGQQYPASTSGYQASSAGTTLESTQGINYHPVYSAEQQQQQQANQQAQPTQVQQYMDVSGNTYYRYVNAAGQVIQSTTLPEQITVSPDIAALDSDPVGPTIKTVALSEYYHENYKLYEERFGDFYAIYTNVANGSITNVPAMFDVPSGVSVRMTRDGKEVTFVNKQQFTQEGTYVLQFYIPETGYEYMPAWQQTIDWARFSFRIQYTAGLDGQPLVSQQAQVQQQVPVTDNLAELEAFAELVPDQSEPASVTPAIPEGLTEEELAALLGELEGQEQTAEETPGETPEEQELLAPVIPGEEESGVQAPSAGAGALKTEYDTNAGYYRMSLLTGDSFYSNVPDGMTTNRSVIIRSSDERIRYEVYRNGELIDYTPGEYIQENGDYTLIPVMDNLEYEGYYRMGRPMMKFRIINGSVSDAGAFSAPQEMTIAAVRHNSEDVTDKAMISDHVASLGEDGSWEIDLQGLDGVTTVRINRDTVPPAVNVKTEPNLATITYLSEDVAGATLRRGDEVISENTLITQVTDAGRYRLTVWDAAGNETAAEFAVQYRINTFAIVAILMVIGLVVGIFFLLKFAGTKVRVR